MIDWDRGPRQIQGRIRHSGQQWCMETVSLHEVLRYTSRALKNCRSLTETFIMRTARTLTGQIDETSIQEQFCGLYHGQIGGLLGI